MNHKTEFLRRRLPCITGAVLLLLSITTGASALTTEQLAEKALAATVSLEMKDSTGTTLGFGSGFFVKPNQIATNFHVIEGARQGTAKLVGKDTTYNIKGIVATDKENDLAILKVTASGVAPLSLGDSDTVKIGARVYVAGNPKGLEGTFSDGLISRRESYPKKRLQMTAPISPGSSGGPVLNSKGEVIGISVAVHRALDAQNLNFAIPSNYLKALLAKARPAKPLSQNSQSISAETYFLRGNAKYELGLYHEAISDYDKAIRLNPDYAFAYNNRGNAKDKLKQYFAAIADFDKAIRLNPDYAAAYHNRGLAKAHMKQYFAAIADFDTAIRLNPDYAHTYFNRGLAKQSLKQYAAAIVDYDTGIRLDPDDAKAYYTRGNAKYNLKQYFAAISDYDMAIRLEPDNADAYHSRGNAKYNLKQYFAAISDYDMAIRLEPGNADAYHSRGLAKQSLKQYFAAISDYDTAIRLNPDDTVAYYNRGLAKALLDRTWEAKQDLGTALRLAEKAGDTDLKVHIEETLRLLE
ncbi:hypothetical protein C6495_10240 [Candidatus Poribacteria bacterium]|nr:MAG: hypothetical protein C6495_10240 [Candidatus Poribacteria bacterium]